MSIYSISFNGLTEQEIRENYPFIVFRVVTHWMEFPRREDSIANWLRDHGLFEVEDFYSDITDYADPEISVPETMVEIWAFKDSSMAVLFKLTWGGI